MPGAPELADNEVLLRVYFRAESDPNEQLVPGDFDRRRKVKSCNYNAESGISVFRQRYCDVQGVLQRVRKVRPADLRGIAHIDVIPLKRLGFKFTLWQDDPAHVSLHCRCCDGSLNPCDGSPSCGIWQGIGAEREELADLFVILHRTIDLQY